MVATLGRMGRKKPKASDDAPAAAKKVTKPIRVDDDLARKLAIISNVSGDDVSDIVSPLIRPHIERMYAEAVERLAQDVRPDTEDK